MPCKALEGRTKGEKAQAFQPWEHLYKSTELPGGGVLHKSACLSGGDLLDYIGQGWSLPHLTLCTDLHWNCRF